MDFNSFQVFVIKDTYELYDNVPEVQSILAPTWGLKLRGYRDFFESGICPNDKLDFFSSHIIITDKSDPTRVLAAIKNISYNSCVKYGIEFPAIEQMFGKEIERKDFLHVYALDKWIEKNKSFDIGYSGGFTMDSSLPKNIRKYLFDFISFSFCKFYKDNEISYILHGVNTLAKIDKKFEKIGFDDLYLDSYKIDCFKMSTLMGIDVRLMVAKANKLNPLVLEHCNEYEQLWDNRVEFSEDSILKKLKVS